MKTRDELQRRPASLIDSSARVDQTAEATPDRDPGVREPRDLSALPEPFHILERTDDGRSVIVPCGELDLSNTAQLEERLQGKVDTVLDLSALSFIDSTGISLLFGVAKRAQREGWDFTVRKPQPAVLRVIKLVALDQHLELDG